MQEKKSGGLASLLLVIFAIIGVACATVVILKKLKERKAIKESESFDDLDDDDFCDCDCCCEEHLEDEAEEEAEEAEEDKDEE